MMTYYRTEAEDYEIEARRIQKGIVDYFRANPDICAGKAKLMDILGLDIRNEPLGAPVKFHWHMLRVNEGLRSIGFKIEEVEMKVYALKELN